MSADNPPPAPYWVAGPDLKMTSEHDLQFNYGGNLEEGFEGSSSETTGFSMESLKQGGTVDHYEYTLTVGETYPNTNEGDDSNVEENFADNSGIGNAETSDTGGSNPTARFDKEGGANSNVPEGGKVVTASNGDRYVYDADGKLIGMLDLNGNLIWPLSWPKPSEDPGDWAAIPPSVRPPWMDWNAVDQNGDPCHRIHCPDEDFPVEVPVDWSREKIERLIDEAETSIRNRERCLNPDTESPEAHRPPRMADGAGVARQTERGPKMWRMRPVRL